MSDVKEGAQIDIRICVLDVSEKLFHTYALMMSEGRDVAISEILQMHNRQKPTPKSVTISLDIRHRLGTYLLGPKHQSKLKNRARAMSL